MTTTTTTVPARTATNGVRRRALTRMVTTEARLLLRDGGAAFFTVFFPALLLIGLGLAMPWADEPFGEGELASVTAITGYTPIALALAIGTASLQTMPTTLAGYREKGVLRRLSTTPMPPSRVLLAQLLVTLGGLVVASVLAVVAAVVVLDVSLPTQPVVVLAAFLLGAGAAMSLGCLIAARTTTAGAATGIGMTAWVVSMFFAGVWMPLPLMPEAVQTIAGYTPLGAASQALGEGWYGSDLPAQQLVVMAVWTAVVVPLAARLFRWT